MWRCLLSDGGEIFGKMCHDGISKWLGGGEWPIVIMSSSCVVRSDRVGINTVNPYVLYFMYSYQNCKVIKYMNIRKFIFLHKKNMTREIRTH